MGALLILTMILGLPLGSPTQNVDDSLDQANIYLQRPKSLSSLGEIPMQEVEQLDSKTDIKVIVHGYLGNRGHSAIVPLRNAYLAQGIDNVFMADWERSASYDYPTSRNLIPKVASRFAGFLSKFMTQHEIDPNDVHLIGHSLGAHIVGGMGRYFNGTIGRITGLDPALPLFTSQSQDGLKQTDGQFVDVIHTDHPVFGDQTPRGHADFYPNLGRTPQPGCNDADLRTFTSCSHYRAVLLYAESVGMPKNFPAIPCSLHDIRFRKTHLCKRRATLGTTVFMGEYIERSATGQYFLTTNDAPPFGFGDNSAVYKGAQSTTVSTFDELDDGGLVE